MSFNQPVYFVTTAAVYNYETGNHDPTSPQPLELFANVTTQTDERSALSFGKINQTRLVVRLQTHQNEPFDHLLINGKKYSVSKVIKLRRKHVFHVVGL